METVNFKRQEALFRQTVKTAHQIFCNCGDPTRHLKEWRSSGEGTSTGGTTTDLGGLTATPREDGDGHVGLTNGATG